MNQTRAKMQHWIIFSPIFLDQMIQKEWECKVAVKLLLSSVVDQHLNKTTLSQVQHHILSSFLSTSIWTLFSLPDADAELFGVNPDSDPFSTADSNPDGFGADPPVEPHVNGRESDSPEMFDLSRLAPPLSAAPTRVCRTPEAFLGPTGASLVNLDALITPNPPSKMHNNPFLSGTRLL